MYAWTRQTVTAPAAIFSPIRSCRGVAGVTPAAGGVTFTGDLNGTLLVFNSRIGGLVTELKSGGALAGGVVTYEAPRSSMWPLHRATCPATLSTPGSTERNDHGAG